MLKIGEFSRITQVSVKTLRYYDEVGLLQPAEVDLFSGYRYYTLAQLPRLNRILALKDLGLSLEQIGLLLRQDLPAGQLRGMLRMKQAEIAQQVQESQSRLERVEARLLMIEKENSMSTYDVVIKKIEPLWVAGVRDIIPSYPEQGGLWMELESYLGSRKVTPTGACFAIYHADEPQIDAEVCEPLAAPVTAGGRVQVHQLPAIDAASTIHHGPFLTIPSAYEALIQWIEKSGYRISGPCREHYLQPPRQGGDQNDPETITEIQFPVEKA
jgi:DNA-binding transcriptional MerR regulator